MNIDTELEVWRDQWQSEATIPVALRRKVERQTRFMKIALVADILVTVVIGGGTIVWALRSPLTDTVLFATATWLFIAAAWAFSVAQNRGNWAPSALDTAGFVDLSVRRCRSRLAAVRVAAGLFVWQTAFCLGWVYLHSSRERPPLGKWLWFSSLPIDVVWASTVAFFGFLFWYRRKKRAELEYLVNLRGELSG